MAGGGNELARKTGIPRRTLENYLSGNTEPVPSRLIAIAKAAGADLLWLMAGAGEFKPAQPSEEAGAGDSGSGGSAYESRLEKMRTISATLREAVGREQLPVNRQLWTDLQGLAFIHNLPHEAIPPIVELITRAYKNGAGRKDAADQAGQGE